MVALGVKRYLAVVVLFLLQSLASGRYEDQAGKFDWHKQLVGKPLFAYFSEPVAQQSAPGTVYVATQSGVLAALNANRGDAQWRIAAEKGARIASMFETKDQVVALIELEGRYYLRSFHMVSSVNSGLLSWESLLNATARQCERCAERVAVIRVNSEFASLTRAAADSQSLIAVAFDVHLFVVRARDGEVLLRTELNFAAGDKSQPSVDWLDAATAFQEDYDSKFEPLRLLLAVSSGSQRKQLGFVDVLVSDDAASFDKRPVFEPLTDSGRVRAESCALVGAARSSVACVSREGNGRQLLVFSADDQQGKPITVDLEDASGSSARIKTVKRVMYDSACRGSSSFDDYLIVNDALVRVNLKTDCAEILARAVLAHRVASTTCDSDALRIATLSATGSQNEEILFNLIKVASSDLKTDECRGTYEQVADARIRLPNGYPAVSVQSVNDRERGWISVRLADGGVFSAARCLVVLADDSMHLFTVSSKPAAASTSLSAVTASMKHVWTREEALAKVELAEFVDLPVSVTFDNNADEAEAELDELAGEHSHRLIEVLRRSCVAFRRRIQAQIGQIRDAVTFVVRRVTDTEMIGALLSFDFAKLNRLVQIGGDAFASQTGNPVSESTADLASTVQPKTDYFNLNKMMVLVTSVGKLFGVESSSGRLVWRKYVPGWRDRRKEALYALHVAVDEPRRLALIGTDLASETDEDAATDLESGTHALVLDPITGDLLDDQAIGSAGSTRYTLLDVDLSAFHDEADIHEHDSADPDADAYAFRKPLLLFDLVQERASLFGATRASARAFVRFARRRALNFYTVDREHASLTGFRLWVEHSAAAAPSRADANAQAEWTVPIRVNRSWSVTFGSGGANAKQELVTVATRLAHEPLHSIGRPLGDRNVLYKYLNPNLVAVALQASYVQDDQARTLVSIHLIDTVTGQFIYQAQHKRASGPVHITVSENWLLYSFMNRKKYARQELVSVEFFEGSRRANGTAFSAFQARPIYPSSQAYYMHMPIEAMRVTWTAAGITTKSVLLALANGAVVEMPKVLFDSRRTMNYTADLQEEGVLQYAPELPVVPHSVLTYGRSLHGVRRIVTTSTGLESTCLALAFGGPDIFFDRVAPSRMYDVLKEDFEYALIAVVTLGLLGGAFVLRQLAFRRALQKAWYS